MSRPYVIECFFHQHYREHIPEPATITRVLMDEHPSEARVTVRELRNIYVPIDEDAMRELDLHHPARPMRRSPPPPEHFNCRSRS